MATTPRKTFPELQALSAPVVDSDVLAVYRSPGPAKRTTASVLGTYVNTVIGTAFTRTLLATANNSTFLTALGQIASTFVDFLSTLSGAVNRTLRSKLGDFVSVKDFGALGDGIRFTDGAITSGTDDFVSASSVFVAGDVGKTIVIEGAGAAGVQLITTITARVSSTAVTLAANASTTVSSADGSYATDDTAAINAALAVGGCLYFPKGIYQISDRLLVTQNNTFIRMEGGVTVQGDPWTYPGSQSPFGAFFLITGDNCSIVGGGMGQTLIQIQGGSQAIGVCFLHCAGGYLANLTLDGDKINGAAISDDTFQAGVFVLNETGSNPDDTFSNAIIYDVECRNWLQYGAQTYGILSRTTFQDCWFHSNGKVGDAVSVGAGLTFTRGPRGMRVVNCLIENNKFHGVFGASAGPNAYDISVSSCTLRDNGGWGISWTEEAPYFSEAGKGTDGLTVVNNQIYGNTSGGERYGTYDNVGFIKNVVSDNINYDNGTFGVLIQSNNDATNKVSNVDIRGRITANTTGLGIGSDVVTSVRWNAQNITGNTTNVSNSGLNTFYSGALGVGTAVASASTITLPADGDIFTITGTTTINTITASPGRTVTLVPTSAVTFSTSGNIDSPTSINAAANDAVQFTCIGSTWYIVAANAKNFPTLIVDRVVSDSANPTSGQFSLSAWGNTSTITELSGGDQCARFRITSAGTGQALYPTVTFTFSKAFAVAPTIASVQRCGGNQNTAGTWFSPATTTTTWEFRWDGTPVAGEFYDFVVTVI
jgi:hypothetical protein